MRGATDSGHHFSDGAFIGTITNTNTNIVPIHSTQVALFFFDWIFAPPEAFLHHHHADCADRQGVANLRT